MKYCRKCKAPSHPWNPNSPALLHREISKGPISAVGGPRAHAGYILLSTACTRPFRESTCSSLPLLPLLFCYSSPLFCVARWADYSTAAKMVSSQYPDLWFSQKLFGWELHVFSNTLCFPWFSSVVAFQPVSCVRGPLSCLFVAGCAWLLWRVSVLVGP